jgi:hypothetical protein
MMPSKKRNLERVEAISFKVSKDGKPPRFDELTRELIQLITLYERGELPPAKPTNNRQPDAPKGEGRAWLDQHLDLIAARIKGETGEGEKVQAASEIKTDEADDLSTNKYLSYVRNRYRI